MRRSLRWLALGALLIFTACSKDKDVDQPAKLTDINATLRVEKVWTASVADKGAKPLRLGLGLAVAGKRVFAAGRKGEVAAYDLASGRRLWSVKTKLALSGGPGAGAGMVVVGSTFGDLIALNETDGATRWKVRLNGEVLSAPVVGERLIAIRTVDGKLHGMALKDGQELWSQEQQVPRLSLRGTSWPVLTGDLVVSGFDNGKVAAINVNDGSVQWETTISPSHGKTELERLDDVDAGVRVSGSDVYAIGFQGRVAMLALDTGQIWWSHDASSFRAIGLDEESLYLSTADGEIIALRRRTGTEIWRQKALLHRRLSSVVEADTSVVTADYQGYVHWLDKATGALAARVRAGKVRISNSPLVVGDMVLIVNDVGSISAFRTTPIGGKRSTTAPAEPGTASPQGQQSAPSTTESAIQGAASDSKAAPAGSASPATQTSPPDASAGLPPAPTSPPSTATPADTSPPQTPNSAAPPGTPTAAPPPVPQAPPASPPEMGPGTPGTRQPQPAPPTQPESPPQG
jgi:outer membrane protein assembly factor BamB